MPFVRRDCGGSAVAKAGGVHDHDTLLGYWAGYCPDKTAIVFGDRRVSFDQHNRRVLRCASALRSLGLRHGDSLAVMLPNCIEFA